jgi:hypothetical protein
MRLRERLAHELAAGFGTHHEDPVVQQIAGLRRVGAAVYDLEQEVQQAETANPGTDYSRARCYFAAAETLVTFADAFVLDAFADPNHPRHLPHVTFVQAQTFYLKIPDLVTAVRQELAYPGAAHVTLPVLPGPRFEVEHCPVEHMLAMQRAAVKVEELIGTRIESLRLRAAGGNEPRGLRPAVLAMAAARTKRDAADQVIGALRSGQHVPPATHEEAEGFYYDGVLRQYLYAAQELELPGVTATAPATEDAPDAEPDEPPAQAPRWQQAQPLRSVGGMGFGGGPFGGGGGGFGFGQLLAADVVGNLIGDLLGGMFGGGGGRGW